MTGEALTLNLLDPQELGNIHSAMGLNQLFSAVLARQNGL